MGRLVLRHDEGGCATLTLNRPEKLNALTVDLFRDLAAHVADLEDAVGRVSVVVLRGAGRCFSAGHDLADIAAGEAPPSPHFQAETIQRLADLPQVVITAVHGHCYTGGLELALAGDLILTAESAKFADTHARWALTPVWGLSQRLPRRVGLIKAREMMFTCRTYAGREAAAFGLANACVPDAGFDAALAALVAEVGAQSWFSHRANKRLLRETDGLPIGAGLAQESYATEGAGPDALTRIAAFTGRARG
ncbi:enoyl-CoA hydratase/isomerase family protein [Phenylobacterium sp.]|uniref:enoyl-CoA hydratase/isomerase family protein n=1 Tax=Phenylobacterium sp. TaxID=1871053 RepID=UPI0025DC4766|nr:enoyl-CoA hydratase/isomerase family protein [Phenylobacterium sp.]MBX3485794.1 enoyl-CoA hydratase/isomerase family protein [Phenylobacterium sp.]MCW5758921.1 enoyl-CoA hydratase/isomerase family protein [Phenylobacterium sp.]